MRDCDSIRLLNRSTENIPAIAFRCSLMSRDCNEAREKYGCQIGNCVITRSRTEDYYRYLARWIEVCKKGREGGSQSDVTSVSGRGIGCAICTGAKPISSARESHPTSSFGYCSPQQHYSSRGPGRTYVRLTFTIRVWLRRGTT